MWLHNMFYPNYKSITDYSVFEKFMFLSIPCIEVEEPSILKEIPITPPILKDIPITTPILKEIPIQTRLEKECLFAKNVQDGLFWAMYIANYGYNEYNRNKYNYGKVEVQEKEKIAEYLHNNNTNKKQTNYKLTRGFCCEIESDLITKPKMPFSGLIGMCAMYSCNIVVVDLNKKIYYLFTSQEEKEDLTKTYILYKNPLHNKSNEYFL